MGAGGKEDEEGQKEGEEELFHGGLRGLDLGMYLKLGEAGCRRCWLWPLGVLWSIIAWMGGFVKVWGDIGWYTDRKRGRVQMNSMIQELWHGNIIPGEDSRTNSKEMKELLGYMSRHHEDLEKSFTDEQKEIFEKFHDCWSEYMSLGEAAIFEYAFKLGMQIAIEALTE